MKPSSDKIAIDRQLVPDTRIEVIDILRGFALLGILIMNIQSFSMVNIAYVNPTVGGTLNGVNFWVYVLTHTLADQKFMTIFSLLFGVSSALIYQKLSAQQRLARVYLVRRNLWLLLIGLLHGCFVWHGDILVSYALSGFILLMLLRLSALIQLSIGLVLLCMPVLINGLAVQSIPYMNEFELSELFSFWSPSAAELADETQNMRGTWWQQMRYRVPNAVEFNTISYLWGIGWRVVGLMSIGVAMFRWGFFSMAWRTRSYMIVALGGLSLGLPLVVTGVYQNFHHAWSLEYYLAYGATFNEIGSVLIAFAYCALMMLVVRYRFFVRVCWLFRDVGRLALSNYLLQSLIATGIFYGHGLGLFGHVERTEQLMIVVIIWGIQWVLSRWWVQRYRYGPAEWLWRSLTQRRWQSIRG